MVSSSLQSLQHTFPTTQPLCYPPQSQSQHTHLQPLPGQPDLHSRVTTRLNQRNQWCQHRPQCLWNEEPPWHLCQRSRILCHAVFALSYYQPFLLVSSSSLALRSLVHFSNFSALVSQSGQSVRPSVIQSFYFNIFLVINNFRSFTFCIHVRSEFKVLLFAEIIKSYVCVKFFVFFWAGYRKLLYHVLHQE